MGGSGSDPKTSHRMDQKSERTECHQTTGAKEIIGGTHRDNVAGEPHVAGTTRMLDHATTRLVAAISVPIHRRFKISIGPTKPCTDSVVLLKSGRGADSGRHEQPNNHHHHQRTRSIGDNCRWWIMSKCNKPTNMRHAWNPGMGSVPVLAPDGGH